MAAVVGTLTANPVHMPIILWGIARAKEPVTILKGSRLFAPKFLPVGAQRMEMDATVGAVVPAPVSPLLPFSFPRIIMTVGKTLTATSVAAAPFLVKSFAKTLTATAVAAVGSITKSVGKRLSSLVGLVGSIANSVPTSEVFMSAVVAIFGTDHVAGWDSPWDTTPWDGSTGQVGAILIKSVGKKLTASAAALVASIANTFLAGSGTFQQALSAIVAVVTDSGAGWGEAPWGSSPWGIGVRNGLIKSVLKNVSVSIPSTLSIVREVNKTVLTDPVASVATFVNLVGKTLGGQIAVVATDVVHAIRAQTVSAIVAVVGTLTKDSGVNTAQAMTATAVAVSGVIRKQVGKQVPAAIAAVGTIRRQAQLHILAAVSLVASFTNLISKKITAVVHLVGLPGIARFGLHFTQVMSATVHAIGHLMECFQLTSHVHHPGSNLPLTPEDTDDTLDTNPHDSGCQGD